MDNGELQVGDPRNELSVWEDNHLSVSASAKALQSSPRARV